MMQTNIQLISQHIEAELGHEVGCRRSIHKNLDRFYDQCFDKVEKVRFSDWVTMLVVGERIVILVIHVGSVMSIARFNPF